MDKAINEIMELADFHSVGVPVEYGDGTVSHEKMVPLSELNAILYEILGDGKAGISGKKEKE